MQSLFQGPCSNFGSVSWSRGASCFSAILVAVLLALPTVTLCGVSVATADSPQAQNPKMKSFMMAPSAGSLTKTTAMRFSSEISDQNCEDMKDFLYKGNAKKDCKWATKRRGNKCKKTDKGTGILVADACPSACDLRCSCRNKKKAFTFNGEPLMKCSTIKKSDCSSADADGKILADFCPKRCNDCYKHRSGSPTEAPFSSEWTQVGSDIDGEYNGDYSGWSVSMSSDGTRVAIIAPNNDENSCEDYFWVGGHVRVYEYDTSGEWAQLGSDIDGECGYSARYVSISSDGARVAVAIDDKAKIGEVRVYEYASGGWTQLGSNIDGEAQNDRVGFSVSMSLDGARFAIGVPNKEAVRVYDYASSSGWTKLGSDIKGEDKLDSFGRSVSMSSDGTRVAIGAHFNDGVNGENSGHVRVYEYTSSGWTQLGSDIDGEAEWDGFGESVSISLDGIRVAIAAPFNQDGGFCAGHVRVHEFASGEWTQLGSDIDGRTFEDFGDSVSMSSDGTRVAIGASRAGLVRVYKYASSEWTQIGKDLFGEEQYDKSGTSVSLSSDGTRVAIGAPSNGGAGGGSNFGHVRVYKLE